MSFLTLGGVAVPVQEGSATVDYVEIGDRGRTIEGVPEASVRARKRTWSVRTGNLSTTDAATLRSTLTATPTVTAAGDWMGGNVTVFPEIGQDAVAETEPTMVTMSLTVKEA